MTDTMFMLRGGGGYSLLIGEAPHVFLCGEGHNNTAWPFAICANILLHNIVIIMFQPCQPIKDDPNVSYKM